MEEISDKEDSSRVKTATQRMSKNYGSSADKSMRASVVNLKMQKQMIAQQFMDEASPSKARTSIKRGSIMFMNPGGVDLEEL